MKLLLFLLLFALLLNSCHDECADSLGSELSETDLEWFSTEQGDTSWYKDVSDEQLYFFTCTKRKMGIDSSVEGSFVANSRCPGEGFWSYRHYQYLEFNSNIPHYDSLLFLKLFFRKGEAKSHIMAEFYRDEIYDYTYHFWFNDDDKKIEAYPGYAFSIPTGIGYQSINGSIYDNVFSIAYTEDTTINKYIYYDSIYINKDGFLKFISSQYGHRLEILE
jgi:hypothetical protein